MLELSNKRSIRFKIMKYGAYVIIAGLLTFFIAEYIKYLVSTKCNFLGHG